MMHVRKLIGFLVEGAAYTVEAPLLVGPLRVE